MLAIGMLAVAYLAAGYFGLQASFAHSAPSALWAPTGLSLAALLLVGREVWPGVFLGAFFVNLSVGCSVVGSIVIGIGNTLEAVVGAWLVSRFASGRHAFERPQDLLKFVLLGGLVAPVVSASVGLGGLLLDGAARIDMLRGLWVTWWLGNVAGALIVTPVLILWFTAPRVRYDRARVLEAILLGLTLATVAASVYGGALTFIGHQPFGYACLPPLVWAAIRFGLRETSLANFGLAAIAVWGTLGGHGPFAHFPSDHVLLLLQSYLCVTITTHLLLAAALLDQRRTLDLIRASEEAVKLLVERKKVEEGFVEELQRVNRVKDEFLASMSHELRTPLNAIIGFSELLLNSSSTVSANDRGALEHVHAAGLDLLRLVNDLLDLARIESGHLDLRPEPFDLGMAIREAASILSNAAERKGIRLGLPDGDLGNLCADRARFRQILFNLLSNAIKFTPCGGAVAVDVTREDHTARIVVQDDGIGIDPADQGRIFEAFVQGGRGHDGSGLGLAITRQLVSAHGGRLELESALGQGSRFIVVLPQPEVPIPAAETAPR